MPLYMDRHDVPGLTAEDAAVGHLRDVEVQDKYGVRYLTYWFDEATSSGFCLVEAPSKDAAVTVHREAHGLIPANIIEVDARVVEQFLGKIQEPPLGEPWVEIAFRAILFTDMEGSTTLTQRLGDARAMTVVRTHDTIARETVTAQGGSVVKHTGDGVMASFVSVVRAVESAVLIQRRIAAYNEETPQLPIGVRTGLNAGEPVTERDDLFGAAVQLARRICDGCEPGRILASAAVRDLCLGKGFPFESRGEMAFKGFEEPVRVYEVRWQESGP